VIHAGLTRAGLVALATLLVTVAVAGAAHARDAVTEGRFHLRKANALAGNDRCEAAIKEYSLAYEKLHDPVVLFNRAECYRRIGEDASAAADYRAFLAAVPGAPNRTAIEAKIAALDLSAPPGAMPAPARVASGGRPPRPAPPSLAAPNLVAPAAPPSSADTPLGPLVAMPAAPEDGSAPATPTSTSTSTSSSGSKSRGRLWMWAALGVAVAGGALSAYVVLRTPGATPPATELGNYRF
jgi:hypothetical protein